MSKRGFTLVELLVVVSIIAILSVVGITIFTSVQKNARDARRKADIDVVATALEAHYNDGACGASASLSYCRPLSSWFAGGDIPYDPRATGPGVAGPSGCGVTSSSDHYQTECWYCYNLSNTAANYCGGPDGFVVDRNWVASPTWKVCANLESGGYYCRRNTQ